MTIIPAPGRLRQEDHEFEASPGYIMKPHLKKKKKRKNKNPFKFYHLFFSNFKDFKEFCRCQIQAISGLNINTAWLVKINVEQHLTTKLCISLFRYC
jgi:hypothetical protein